MSNNKRGVQYSVTRQDNLQRGGKPSQGITTARLVNTENDVINIVNNSKVPIMVADGSKYRIANTYHATTSCLEADTYDENKGKDISKRKCLLKYNADKIAKIDEVLADIEVVRNRLLRQRGILSSRMAKDIEYLDTEVSGN